MMSESNGRFLWQEYVIAGLLLLVLLLALVLRCYHLDAQSLWNDEGTSVALAQRDQASIARDAAQDIHPPLYYWLLSGWTRLVGTSEAAVRSLSVLLGVVLVALTYTLGHLSLGRWVALAAALLAAINPFQVYYSQEARMYMLAAVLAAGAMLALIIYVSRESWPILLALVLLEAAGLYTHYSFVFVVLILNLGFALQLRPKNAGRKVWVWALSQAIVLLIYAPWLPAAARQVTTWPSPTGIVAPLPALAETWRWMVFGPTIETGQVAVPLLLTAALALFGGLALAVGWVAETRLKRTWVAGLLTFWLGLPVILMFALGLFREAYLKFLLVAAPALSLLLASGLMATPQAGTDPRDDAARSTGHTLRFGLVALRSAQVITALALLIVSAVALQNYYADPAYARDDYRAIASYIDAVGRPGDVVLLNAPGQQEVFDYYYQGDLAVHPLPESRPLDPAATESALLDLAELGGRVFAVLWATDESDPDRFIEGWLDEQAYKALDSWYGNVRLVVYAVPQGTHATPRSAVDVQLASDKTGDEILLLGYTLQDDRLAAGDIAQITLFWNVNQTPARRYKVFLHVVDGNDQIVGQRDAEPGGGARLTTLWEPGETLADNYGVPLHPATAPGEYRVAVGMYNPETGQRLLTPDGQNQVWLEPLAIERPPAPVPIAALGMQHSEGVDLGELTLLGYDAHELGFAHDPEEPLSQGDLLHVNLYWRAEAQPTDDWQVVVSLEDSGGQEWTSVTAQPVEGYPATLWRTGDVWRGQLNLALPGDMSPGRYQLRVGLLGPDGTPLEGLQDALLSEPLRIER